MELMQIYFKNLNTVNMQFLPISLHFFGFYLKMNADPCESGSTALFWSHGVRGTGAFSLDFEIIGTFHVSLDQIL